MATLTISASGVTGNETTDAISLSGAGEHVTLTKVNSGTLTTTSVSVQGSVDGTNWFALVSNTNTSGGASNAANEGSSNPRAFNFVRLSFSVAGGGSVDATAVVVSG